MPWMLGFLELCNLSHSHGPAIMDTLVPAKEGETLEAEAVERSASGRTGVYDITVRTMGGKTVALFRGKSYRINGEVIAGLQQADQA